MMGDKDIFNVRVVLREGQYVAQISSNMSNLDDKSPVGLFAKATVTAMNKYLTKLSAKKKRELQGEINPPVGESEGEPLPTSS